jgi:hypothetical protein
VAAWLVITASGKKHFFTSETGTTVFGSKSTTKDIYDTLNG